jgi:uncharacterized protein (UPF0332 family)
MKLHDCYGDNLLRMETPSPEKAKKALEIAYERTTRGKALLEKDFFEESLICCYTAMFQAARALLFREGIIEKSHACVIAYLEEVVAARGDLEIKYVTWLDTYRKERHMGLYGFEPLGTNEDDAKLAHERACQFIDVIRKIINKKK